MCPLVHWSECLILHAEKTCCRAWMWVVVVVRAGEKSPSLSPEGPPPTPSFLDGPLAHN